MLVVERFQNILRAAKIRGSVVDYVNYHDYLTTFHAGLVSLEPYR
jgi:hypothetical protein